MTQLEPSFNLWSERWITLERHDGTLVQASIEHALRHADEFRAIYDPSPLVIVGIHRLLTAILQDALHPQRPPDLRRLWSAGCFPEEDIQTFGEQYVHRFDLFSADQPFLQSADLPLAPPKRASGLKSVTYLTLENPAGSAVAHYRHGIAMDNVFCPRCAARGLVTVPAFATSGGAGIKPSINGVPPIYVQPGGETLFESLTASLILPPYQPTAAAKDKDAVWWRHKCIVSRKAIISEVGYLHSLTFPARRIRLHPEPLHGSCARCGQESAWGVRTMIYRMGESRPKDAPFWQDPFVAYQQRGEKAPTPIRPKPSKALWREFAALFLPSQDKDEKERTFPPNVLYQLANEDIRDDPYIYPFRCVGMRTDMKAKVFEWIDAGFDVPIKLFQDIDAATQVREAIDFANDCARIIVSTFRKTFVSADDKTPRHETLRQRMMDAYWATLAVPFREFVLSAAAAESRDDVRVAWVKCVVNESNEVFKTYSEMTGSDAATLRQRVQGRKRCAIRLGKKRKEQLSNE